MCEICGHPSLKHEGTLPRRQVLSLGVSLGVGIAASFIAPAWAKGPAPKPENIISPAQALARLKAGNRRFVEGVTRRHNFNSERAALLLGQNPFAAILSCADSRVVPEYAFDTSRGDLFIVRVAGNFVNPDNLASFEYAVEDLKTPLILVLGHESCGAVKAAIAAIKDHETLPGHLPDLVAGLKPAVTAVLNKPGNLLENAILENVRENVANLKAATPILSAAVAEKRIAVVGGVYRLATGKVNIIGSTV